MRGALSATVMLLLCGLCLQTTQPVSAQSSSDPAADETVGTEEFFYVGVMGEVTFPGVYEFETPEFAIADVVKRAGGWTNEAKGSIGVVRNAQPAPEKFYALDLEEKLQPGDIIVVDRAENLPPSPKRDKNQLVQLAFLNVLDRPVVIEMPDNMASLTTILHLLGQPQKVLGSVVVIETGAANGLPRLGTGPTSPLPKGTVLSFDIDETQYDLIPPQAVETFPAPMTIEGLAANDKKAAEAPTATTPSSETIVAGHDEEDDSATVASAISEEVELLPGPEDDSQLPSIHPRTIPKNRRTYSADREQIQTTSLDERVLAAPLDVDNPVAPPPPEMIKNQSQSASTVAAVPLAEEVLLYDAEAGTPVVGESQRTGRIAILVAVIIGVLVSVAAFAVLWITIGRQTTPVAATAAPTQLEPAVVAPKIAVAPATQNLDALVKDELTVVEERVADKLPNDLHGRSVAPRKIRVDAGHTDVKPHVHPAGHAVSLTSDLVFQTSTDEQTDLWGGPGKNESSDGESPSAQSVLGRVLSSVHGANTR